MTDTEAIVTGQCLSAALLRTAIEALKAETASEECTPGSVRARMVDLACAAGFFGDSLTSEELHQACARVLPLSERGCLSYFGISP